MASIKEALELALDHQSNGRLDEAEILYDRVIAADAEQAAAWGLSGALLFQTGRTAEGLKRLARAMALAPGVAGHHDNMARALIASGRRRDAACLLPADPTLWRRLGEEANARGDAVGATIALSRSACADPADPSARYGLACVLDDRGRTAEAERAMRRGLALAPSSAHLTFLRAVWEERAHRPMAAIAGHRRSVALAPDRSEPWLALGAAALNAGDVGEAEAALRHHIRAWPDDWRAWSAWFFVSCFRYDADPAAVFTEYREFDARFARPLRPAEPVAPRSPETAPDPDRPLRVGYVSPNFYGHPCGHALLPVIENHDPATFTVHCYSTSATRDAWTDSFEAHSARYRSCHAMTDPQLTETIRGDGIDILVDCSGHLAGNRLFVFARKPAPIQVSFPLFPATTGLSAIDYRIMDRHFAPPWSDAFHTEKLVRMPDAHVVYREKPSPFEPSATPPMRKAGFVRFGCFNSLAKANPPTVAAWAEILRRVPDSRLVMKWRGLDEPLLSQAIRARFIARGIAPERIETIGWEPDSYAAYGRIDIALDPLDPNGGTSTCDALWAGTPVISRVGWNPFGRVGLCHLTAVGLPELLAADDEGYVALAVRLAGDPEALTRIRTGLRRRMAESPLMDGRRYTRHLEDAYRTMWRRRCAGLPAQAFDVHAGPQGDLPTE